MHGWQRARIRGPMGIAITARDLLHDAPIAATFVGWLRELFAF